MDPDVQALTRRLEALERQNRRLRRAGIGLAVLTAIFFMTGLAPKDRVVDAEAFTLLGAEGKPRAVLAMVDSEPTLAFFDTEGRVRAGVSVVGNTPHITLYREDGSPMWQAP